MQQSAVRTLARFASLRITAVAIGALLLGVLVIHFLEQTSWLWLVLPIAVLVVNLGAALIVDPRLYRRPGLLTFHIGLLAVLLLVAYGELVAFHGRVELVEGQDFDASGVQIRSKGPWHRNDLSNLAFRQGAVSVRYGEGMFRLGTSSEIRRDGAELPEIFGDSVPFEVGQYAFYTTSNKGFAALVTWTPSRGKAQRGALHLPSFPLNEWNQTNRWRPNDSEIELDLELLDTPRPAAGEGFLLDRRSAQRLALKISGGSDVVVLTPGQTAAIAGGRVRFDGASLWMGYEIRSEPVTLWTFLAAIVGIAGIALHFLAPPRVAGAVPAQRGAVSGAGMEGVDHA